MQIEDEEIREIFKTDSLDHIQKIESSILEWESNPTSEHGFKSVFREAHSLKGSAGILGLKEIESITHVLEEYLGRFSKGYGEYNPQYNDRILYVLDQLKLLVNQAVTGEKARVDIKKTVEILQGKEDLPKETAPTTIQPTMRPPESVENKDATSKNNLPNVQDQITTSIPNQKNPPKDEPKNPPPKKTFKIETMRVDPEKLDALLGNTGELIIAKNRIQKRSQEISDLLMQWEEFSKVWRNLGGLDPKARNNWEELLKKFTSLKVKSQQDATKLDLIANKLDEGVQKVRLLPLSSVFEIFPRVVRDIGRELGKEVYLTLEGGDATADKLIIEECKDSLMHLVRNSLDHGIETRDERVATGKANPAKIRIAGKQTENFIQLIVEDDGRGLDINKIKEKAIAKGIHDKQELDLMTESQIFGIIFHQGFSTRTEVTNISGRGVGMDIVRNFAERFKGTIDIESSLGHGTKFTIKIPINFSTNKVLIIGVNGWKYGIPTEFVKQSLVIRKEKIHMVESKPTISFANEPVRIVAFADYYPISYIRTEYIKKNKRYETCIVLEYNGEKFAILIDYIYEKQEIILKPFQGIMEGTKKLAGNTILESGEICFVPNIPELFLEIKGRPIVQTIQNDINKNKKNKPILVVEDSLITRAQLQRILESDGYPVITATNGKEGLEKVKISTPHLILTDIEMPELDGFGLIKELKRTDQFKNIPILVLTSLGSKEHIERGKELGADSYLVKSQFDQSILLSTVEMLVAGADS